MPRGFCHSVVAMNANTIEILKSLNINVSTGDSNSLRSPSKVQGWLLFAGDGDNGIAANLRLPSGPLEFALPLLGDFNVENLLVVLGVLFLRDQSALALQLAAGSAVLVLLAAGAAVHRLGETLPERRDGQKQPRRHTNV